MGKLLKSKMEKTILEVIDVHCKKKQHAKQLAVTMAGVALGLETLAHNPTMRVCAVQGPSELRLP